jgi:hypothetical protein
MLHHTNGECLSYVPFVKLTLSELQKTAMFAFVGVDFQLYYSLWLQTPSLNTDLPHPVPRSSGRGKNTYALMKTNLMSFQYYYT